MYKNVLFPLLDKSKRSLAGFVVKKLFLIIVVDTNIVEKTYAD